MQAERWQVVSSPATPKERPYHKWSFFFMDGGVIYALQIPLIVWSKTF